MKKRIILVLTLCVILTFSSCASRIEMYSVTVSWFDSDGSLILTEEMSEDSDPTFRELPGDTNEWHYTKWTVSRSGNLIVCTAIREPKLHMVWKDHDGSLIYEEYVTEPDWSSERELPADSDKWVYTEWERNTVRGGYEFIAQRKPNSQYFEGNVFQIVVNDAKGKPTGTGSGFVLNSDGWFITNDHVMSGAASAMAFFDIPNDANGEQYTKLNIVGGVYNNTEKDFFIGKIENYKSISDSYSAIEVCDTYERGDSVYSVGYPNASTNMVIASGNILKEYSDIIDKINGVYYILSDSYIAPGSSGGVLVDEELQVLGITTMGIYADEARTVYQAGGSLPTSIFKPYIGSLDEGHLKRLDEIYHNIEEE